MSRDSSSSSSLADPTRRFYTCKVNNITFDVDVRYTNLQWVGGGAYGAVCSADDSHPSIQGGHRKVAIKKVANTFKDLVDAKRILRELKLLRHLGGHENISWILDIMVSPNRRNFRDVYIVTDFMETDLQHIISSPQTLSDSHIKYFVYQILRGLKYVHSANVLHRDLKPSNILVNSNCELVICDFGLARGVEDMEHQELTQYVVTRWYRAPELLSLSKRYNTAIDVWAVGCILAELLGRRPLFPGEHYIHQLQVIVSILGTPARADMEFITTKEARKAIAKLGRKEKVKFKTLYPHANPQAIDLLDKLLEFNPKKRISITDALAHPYLEDYHFPDDEPNAPRKADIGFERMGKLSKQELQTLMLREMAHFHPSNNEKLRMSASSGRPLVTAAQRAEIKRKLEEERKLAADSATGRAHASVAGAGAGAAGSVASVTSAGAGGRGDSASHVSGDGDDGVVLSETAELEKARDAAMAQINADRRQARALAGLAAISEQAGGSGQAAAGSGARPSGGSATTTASASAAHRPSPASHAGSAPVKSAAPAKPGPADVAAITAAAVQGAVEQQLKSFWERLHAHVQTQFGQLERRITSRLDRLEQSVQPLQQRVRRIESVLDDASKTGVLPNNLSLVAAGAAPRLPAASRGSNGSGSVAGSRMHTPGASSVASGSSSTARPSHMRGSGPAPGKPVPADRYTGDYGHSSSASRRG